MREQFNAAIDFAISQGLEARDFLDSWRHGDTSEWPEFKPPEARPVWFRALDLAVDNKQVSEALEAFANDQTGDNAIAIVVAVLEAL